MSDLTFQSNWAFTPSNTYSSGPFLNYVLRPPRAMAGEEIRTLWCLADDSTSPIEVTVALNVKIDHLRKEIKKIKGLPDVDPSKLVLWKLNEPELVAPEETLVQRIKSNGDMAMFARKLGATDRVSTLFPRHPPEDHVHILVQLPSTTSRKRLPEEDGDREAKRQKTDYVLSWLSEVHSEIWNRRDERLKDIVHKVTVTVAHYRELQQRLRTRPNRNTKEDILAIKHDILLNYKSNSNTAPGNEQVPANVNEESGDDDPDLGLFFPATFEFLELSSLKLGHQPLRLPLPLLIRPEYSIILDEIQRQEVSGSTSWMISGQPGTGKTAFLHYMMIKYMLDGIPFLYQSIDGIVYHVYKDKVEIIESWDPFKGIVAFIDADEDKTIPKAFIRRQYVQFILASLPKGVSPKWVKQTGPMVDRIMELWNPWEFYVTGIFLHPYHLDFAYLREAASYFGLNPRRCFEASKSKIIMDSCRVDVINEIRSIDDSVGIYDLMMGTFSSKYASHVVFEMFPRDENRHLAEAQIRAVSKWALNQLMEEYINRQASAVVDFYKTITPIPWAGQLRCEMFRLWALNYFDTIDQPTTFRIRNLVTSKDLDWLYPGPAPRLTFPSQSISTDLWLKIVQNKEPQHIILNFAAVDSILYNPNSVLTSFQISVNKDHPISVSGLQCIQQSLKLKTPLASLRPSNHEAERWCFIFVVPDYEVASYPLQQFEGTGDTGIWAQKVDQYVLGLNEDEIMKCWKDSHKHLFPILY